MNDLLPGDCSSVRIDAGSVEILIQFIQKFTIQEMFNLLGTFVEAAGSEHEMFREERFPQAVRTNQ